MYEIECDTNDYYVLCVLFKGCTNEDKFGKRQYIIYDHFHKLPVRCKQKITTDLMETVSV